MTSHKQYSYADAGNSITGTMRCTKCSKKVVEGEYRYRPTRDGFAVQHRSCVPEDPKWSSLDSRRAKQRQYQEDYLRACKEFKEKWGTSLLDEEIESYESATAAPTH
jgi:hypothetical protein